VAKDYIQMAKDFLKGVFSLIVIARRETTKQSQGFVKL